MPIKCPECRGSGGNHNYICGMCNGSGKVPPTEAFKALIRHTVANGGLDETHPLWPDFVAERGGADTARAAVAEWLAKPESLMIPKVLKVPAKMKIKGP